MCKTYSLTPTKKGGGNIKSLLKIQLSSFTSKLRSINIDLLYWQSFPFLKKVAHASCITRLKADDLKILMSGISRTSKS